MSVIAPRNASSTTAPRQAGGAPAVGDRAGEYLEMRRGHYAAWIHVGFGFFWTVLLIAGTAGLAVAALAGFVTGAITSDHDAIQLAIVVVDGAASIALAYLIFRDRWRCIEAFSSRYCVGLLNLSIIYVPVIAMVYGLVRGAMKLRGR
jgi:hypothetical protein